MNPNILDSRLGRFNNFDGFKVITDRYALDRVQARTHKNNRINKKWLRKYGHKLVPSEKIRIEMANRWLIVHPKYAEKLYAYIKNLPNVPPASIKELAAHLGYKPKKWAHISKGISSQYDTMRLWCECDREDVHYMSLGAMRTEERTIQTFDVRKFRGHKGNGLWKDLWLGLCPKCDTAYWKVD
jgi:hypothetical protein